MNPNVCVLLLLAAGLSASRSISTKAVIRKHRAAVEAKLDAIQAVGQLLRFEIVPTGAPFLLNGPPPQFGTLGGKTNAMIMEGDQLAYPAPERVGFHLCSYNPIADPRSLPNTGEFHGGRPGTPEVKEDLLRKFNATR